MCVCFSPFVVLLISAIQKKKKRGQWLLHVCCELTFDLGMQVVDYNLKLPQRHISQVGGLQTSFHETLTDVRHVWQLKTKQTQRYI